MYQFFALDHQISFQKTSKSPLERSILSKLTSAKFNKHHPIILLTAFTVFLFKCKPLNFFSAKWALHLFQYLTTYECQRQCRSHQTQMFHGQQLFLRDLSHPHTSVASPSSLWFYNLNVLMNRSLATGFVLANQKATWHCTNKQRRLQTSVNTVSISKRLFLTQPVLQIHSVIKNPTWQEVRKRQYFPSPIWAEKWV